MDRGYLSAHFEKILNLWSFLPWFYSETDSNKSSWFKYFYSMELKKN